MLLRTDLGAETLRIPIKGVTEDDGMNFWNRWYLWRYHEMSKRLKCFGVLNEQIFRQVRPNPNAIVLEEGCGSGRNIPHIINAMGLNGGSGKIYAIDFNLASLTLANEKLGDPANVLFKQENMRQLSFESGIFDAAFDIFAGAYMPFRGWRQGVAETFRVLKADGYGYFLYWEHGKNFSKCIRGHIRGELFHNPIGLFWSLHLKLFNGLNIWDEYVKRGEVIYPKIEELVSLIKSCGGSVELIEKALFDTCVFIKAKKS